MFCPSPRGDSCPSAVTRQAGSAIGASRRRGQAVPETRSLPGELAGSPRRLIVTPPTTAGHETSWPTPLGDCAGTARRLTAASRLARLVGTRWNMLADSGVPAMLASRIYAARQSVPYNGPSPSTSSSAVLMRHHVREMQTRCASVILTNIRYVRDLSGNPLCPRAADHMSRNDRRITSHAAAACKTRLHAAPAAVRRAKTPRASGPRGIDWTEGRINGNG